MEDFLNGVGDIIMPLNGKDVSKSSVTINGLGHITLHASFTIHILSGLFE